jgi:sulfate transport system permease protein
VPKRLLPETRIEDLMDGMNTMSVSALTARLLPRPSPTVLPGFGLTMGLTLAWLSLIILIPLAGVFVWSAGLGWEEFSRLAFDPRTTAALKLSFGAALIAAAVNVVFGALVAWVLVRYNFPGKRLFDAAIDLPFALPTAVAGLAFKVAYTPTGIVVALIFIGLPFVVRSVQPVLSDLDKELEEAAATLGATRLQTVRKVVLPVLIPSLLTGFALAFARGVGEYGSIIFIAGNIPYVSEIAPLLIVIRLEEFNYPGATAIAAIMLVISFALLLLINLLQSWNRRRTGIAA